MRKLFLAVLLAVSLLTASGGLAMTITWNEVCDETYGATVGAHVFDEKLRELSGGTMDVDLYINGALGSEAESLQGLQWGTLDVFRGNASSLADYGADLIAATGLPYLFKDMDAFEKMAESPLGQELLDSVEAADCGFVAVAWLMEGPRYLFLTEPAYEKIGRPDSFNIDMMKSLTIRVPGTEIMNHMMKSLGAVPIEIAYSELDQSLRSGNIDGAENGIIPYLSLKFYEGAPYFVTDAHMFGCGVILMSSMTWDQLTDEQKGWMREAGKAASKACYEYNAKQEKAFFAELESNGVKILSVDDIDKWQEACEPLYATQNEQIQALISRIRAEN